MSAELDTFRAEVRAFIDERAPRFPIRAGVRSPEDGEQQQELRRWTAELFAAGYVGADWPVEHGGVADHDPRRDDVVAEELARAYAPGPVSGNMLAARALIAYGTPEQQSAHLARMRAGDEIWCQLFSEPGAGSDLAALRTKAERVGDDFIVNGQKVWTTNGHWADLGYLLARTDADVPKHKGISAFVVDMRAAGVTVRPLREMTGTADFNEVFFDDVRIPATNMIGAPGQGWAIANESLSHERSGVGAGVVALQQSFAALWQRRDALPHLDAAATERLLELHAAIEALAALVRLGSERWQAGTPGITDGPMGKLLYSELNLALAELAVEVLGPDGILVEGDGGAIDDGRWQDMYLYARAFTIAGGTSEIMRNVISERGLGLPREAVG
ncbi:MAG TPA: acyl-CoA dehydrogenase family protein [Mycobacteriales bacterium]|nr:acyl-CoA dehydrogenase family protein [Mycobacteriales bacterium]